jgi:3-phenylpropionate/cinnamic acid dioxygenase small subunit
MPENFDLLRAVEDFLYLEADLMDRHAYDDWLALWDTEATYWAPCNEEDVDPDTQISIIYEHRQGIEDRVFRLKGRHAHAQNPRSRLIRVVSNIRIEGPHDDEIVVSSRFVLAAIRLDRQCEIFGKVTHALIREGDGFRIRRKKVFLINNDTAMGNVAYLV